ncbi:MAG TPA: hypothetical protein VNW96_03980 [Mycobacterium sp.]|jgi:hypothetical protein|nr:hypothetical protein [Mycobacterium sp.]
MEVTMPGRGILGAVVLVWLLIGVFAAWQLHYFENGPTNCAAASTVALTVVAGPLNYGVVNPKVVDCPKPQVPQPHENSLGL